MERKRRGLFVVLIATIIVLAIFSSFAINLFSGNDYQVKLPDLSGDAAANPSGNQSSPGDQSIRIEVAPETVQSVIATLNRPRSYHRTITLELWADAQTSAQTTVTVWVDGGWTRSTVASPGGLIQHNLVGEGTRWLWYEGDETALSFPAGDAAADTVQRIPTYEDVLELPTDRITTAAYVTYAGTDCVFVEVMQEGLVSWERYWISVSDGLLVASERVKDSLVVYRMSVQSTVSPAPLDSSFALPDGTVLHSVGDSD